MTSEQINTANYYRRRNNKYTDTTAATNTLNWTNKQTITPQERPFNKSFEYGASAERYWTYGCMVLQVENCTDVIIALHPKFYILFLFGHSCGHDRGREGGLNINRMGSGYCGFLHPEMHLTTKTRIWIPWSKPLYHQTRAGTVSGIPRQWRQYFLGGSGRKGTQKAQPVG